MNSTEKLQRAFDTVLLPLSGKNVPSRLDFAPVAENGSYFKTPRRARLSRAEMEAMRRDGELAALEAYWRACGFTELLPLMPYLVEAAKLLAERNAKPESGPSDLIYQMY